MAIRSYAKADDDLVSDHFCVREFSCHGTGCCDCTYIDEELVSLLEQIRTHFQAPVLINSGYRCQKHNRSVGGATASQHLKGKAADVRVAGVLPIQVAQFARQCGAGGVGLYDNFVHVDTRKGNAFWDSRKEITKRDDSKTFRMNIQIVCGVSVDGEIGPETLNKLPLISWRHHSRHAAVYFIQQELLELGYTEIGQADGIAGPKFDAAVKHFQRKQDLSQDGIIGPNTWGKLLEQ